MANCKEWMTLETNEKIQLTGKLVHLLQNDTEAFKAFSAMVETAEKVGIFENVRIAPQSKNEDCDIERSFTNGLT